MNQLLMDTFTCIVNSDFVSLRLCREEIILVLITEYRKRHLSSDIMHLQVSSRLHNIDEESRDFSCVVC